MSSKDADKPVGEATDADNRQPIRRDFDGPRHTGVPLRVSFKRNAYADIMAHARESLDAEIGGVLVGEVCEDAEGLFVSVLAAIQAEGAAEQRASITFTHETWNRIHEKKDAKYPKLAICGWYHSHPGFGVELSDMDEFIHKNFFSSSFQVAIVIDPLGCEVAAVANGASGIQSLDRFWVEGREHRTVRTADHADARLGEEAGLRAGFDRLEDRLRKLTQAVEDQQATLWQLALTVALVVATGMLATLGYLVYRAYIAE